MGHRSTVRGRSRQQGLLVSKIVQIDRMTKLLTICRSFDFITLPGRPWSKPALLPAGQWARLLLEGDPRAGASRLVLVLGKGGQAGQEGQLGAGSLLAFLRGQIYYIYIFEEKNLNVDHLYRLARRHYQPQSRTSLDQEPSRCRLDSKTFSTTCPKRCLFRKGLLWQCSSTRYLYY